MRPCHVSPEIVEIVCKRISTTKATSITYLNCDRKKNKIKSPGSSVPRNRKNGKNVCPTLKRHRKGKYTSGSLYLSPVVPESGDISATARRRLSFLCPKQTSVLRKSTCVFTKKKNANRPPKTGKNYYKRSTGPIRSFANG